MRNYLRHGHAFDAAVARALESASGLRGFVNAERGTWTLLVNRISHFETDRQKDASVIKCVLNFTKVEDPAHAAGYMEETLATHIKKVNETNDVFKGFDSRALGRIFSRLGIGFISRHNIYVGEGVNPPRVTRAFILFSDDDNKRMEEITSELPV